MSVNLNDFILEIQGEYARLHQNLLFSTTHSSDIGIFEPIIETSRIPDHFTSQQLVEQNIHIDIVNRINQLEVQYFLRELRSINSTNTHNASQQNMVNIIENAYAEVMLQIQPNFIIWSQGIAGAYEMRSTPEEYQRMLDRHLREFQVEGILDEIIIGRREDFGMTYHSDNLLIQQNIIPATAENKLTSTIRCRFNSTENVSFARITVE